MAAVSSERLVWQVLVGAAFGWGLFGCAGGERLQEFRSAQGRFRILLPGEPAVAPDPHLPKEIRSVRLEVESGTYVVAWEDLNLGAAALSAQERLDLACNAAVEKLKGKALTRKKITLNDRYPGRELVVEGPDGKQVHRDRMYLVDGRLYQVVVSGPRWWVASGTADKVLDSFELIED